MALLRLSDAELHFGTHVLLDKLNLTISKGERLGLLGRNGVGKTTLFKVLTGGDGSTPRSNSHVLSKSCQLKV